MAGDRGFGGVARSASPEAALALLLVGTSARRAAAAGDISLLAARADYARLGGRLRLQGLLGLAGSRLEAHVGERLPEAFRAAVRRNLESARTRGAVQAAFAIRWMARLEAGDIACLPLKGPLLGQRLFGDLGFRSSNDVDLLVSPTRLWEAVALLREDGFAPPRDRLSAAGLPEWHLQLEDPKGNLPRVELHWRVHWYEERFSSDMLSRSSIDPSGYRTPRPVDELAGLLLFFAREGFLGLRQLSDLAAWWDAFGESLAPLALEEIADAYPELRHALATSMEVAGRMAGLPANRLLDERPAFSRRSRAAARMANWNLDGSLGQKTTTYHLIDLLLSPPGGRVAAVRRHLFREPRPRTGMAGVLERIRCRIRPPARIARAAAGLWRVRGQRTFSPPVSEVDEPLNLHQSLEGRGAGRRQARGQQRSPLVLDPRVGREVPRRANGDHQRGRDSAPSEQRGEH
jgi:hypothetical protein